MRKNKETGLSNMTSERIAPWISKGTLQYLVYETDICICGHEYYSAYVMRWHEDIPGKGYIKECCPECEEKAFLENQRLLAVDDCTNHFYKESQLNNKLIMATFESYHPTNEEQEYALNIAKRYSANFDINNPVGLLLYGNYGTGKSHLATSIAKEVIKVPIDTIFISVPKLLTRIRSTFGRRGFEEEATLLEKLSEVTLLILDDIGSENTTEWAQEKLFEIIDNRIGKHTIYTSNLHPKNLQPKIGGRVFSRLMEDVHPIKINGEDYRLKNFK